MSVVVSRVVRPHKYLQPAAITMGADSQYTCNDNGYLMTQSKIFENRLGIFGLTGCPGDLQVLEDVTENLITTGDISGVNKVRTIAAHLRGALKDSGRLREDSGCTTMESTVMVGLEEGVFIIYQDFQVLEPLGDSFAIGSGSDFALGALYPMSHDPEDTEVAVSLAVSAAIEYDIYCGGEINVITRKF